MASPSSPPSIRNLQALVTNNLSQFDRTATRLARVLSTPSGIDTSLLTLGYTLTLLHSRLRSRLETQLRRLALSVAKNASDALLPGETLIASLDVDEATGGRLGRLARVTGATKAFASLIGDFRVFMRLWGLLGIYQWGRTTYIAPPKDLMVKNIQWAQVGVNAAFQFLENGAYLAQHGILNGASWTAERRAHWWLWSSRFWAAHVLLDFIRLARIRQLREQDTVSGQEKEDKVLVKAEKEKWWKELAVNAAYAPLTFHYSLEEGCLTDTWVGLLGMVAGAAGLRQLWNQTASLAS